MNDKFTEEDLQALLDHHGGLAVSIYMPGHPVTLRGQEDTIRLRNLLRDAEEELSADGVRTPDIRAMLAPGHDLLGDVNFWQHQSSGLALFFAPERAHIYRLPVEFESLLTVGEDFHIKPLLPLFTENGTFFVLAVSQNQVRVLRGTKHSVDELDVESIPTSLADALRFDEIERQLQMYTASMPSAGGRGAGMYHGHGDGATDDDKNRILRYFQKIDKGLQDLLHDKQVPLVFAGVEYLLPIYREANSYQHLMETGVTGNPDELRPEELHQAAWAIVEPFFSHAKEQAFEEMGQAMAYDRGTYDIREALSAAYQGRVHTAFVPINAHQWGKFDPERDSVELADEESPETRDLYDQLAMYTLLRGGRVFVLAEEEQASLEQGAKIATVYRF